MRDTIGNANNHQKEEDMTDQEIRATALLAAVTLLSASKIPDELRSVRARELAETEFVPFITGPEELQAK